MTFNLCVLLRALLPSPYPIPLMTLATLERLVANTDALFEQGKYRAARFAALG